MRAVAILMLLLPLLPWSSQSHASSQGAELFSRHCAICHGDNGGGGVGVPLSLPGFLASVDDDYLFKTMRHGRPGRIMPSFDSLSDAQLSAIVAHIRGWQPAGVRSAIVGRPVVGDVERGRGLYRQHCASCHGTDGEGGGGTGVTFSRPRDYPIIPPALNNRGFLASASDQVIRATLELGREGTAMASFARQGLTGQQLDDIVTFVRTFETQPLEKAEHPEEVETTLVVDSPYPLKETVENLRRAAIGKNFRIIRTQTLEDGLFDESEANPKQVVIYFCNFNFINAALKLDPRVGLFMPCRITVVEQEEGVRLYAINPKYLSRLYNNQALDKACQQMFDIYIEIMEEATL